MIMKRIVSFICMKTRRQKKNVISICILVFILSFMSSIVLSLLLGTDMENMLVRQVPVKMEIENNHFFTQQYSRMIEKNDLFYRNRTKYLEYYEYVISSMKEFTSQQELTFVNYNTCFHTANNSMGGSLLLFYGVNSSDFFDRFSLTMTDGEAFSESDLSKDIYKVIVNETTEINDGGTNRKITIGDRISLFDGIQLTVSGVYEENPVYDIYNGHRNSFINMSACFIPEQLAEKIVELYGESPDNIFSLGIDGISFETDNYQQYEKLVTDYNSMAENLNQYTRKQGFPDLGFSVVESNAERILVTIGRIKAFYIAVFSVLVIMLICVFVSGLRYNLEGIADELLLFCRLGDSINYILKQYMAFYLFHALLTVFAGILTGTVASKMICNGILSSITRISAELLSYSNSAGNMLPPFGGDTVRISSSVVLKTSVIITCYVIVIICVELVSFTLSILKDKIRH